MAAEAIDELIARVASEPGSVSVDGQSYTARSLSELIEFDKYKRKKEAVTARGKPCIQITPIIPPGMAD